MFAAAWNDLEAESVTVRARHLRALFADDPARGRELTITAGDLYIDYSKNLLTRETLAKLIALARAAAVEEHRDLMFKGGRINTSEDRAVLHTALRLPPGASFSFGGRDIASDVRGVLDRMGEFADRLRSGDWRGASGERISTVVNIGIGGSDLGPAMVYRALRPYVGTGIEVRFVSNVDPADMSAALQDLDPARTLFIVASKTFTTLETLSNAGLARSWLVDSLGESAVPRHFVAVSTNTKAVAAFGIDPANMFGFWEWVGGRYSVGSSIGLTVMAAIGRERFAEFLAGFHTIDEHFRTAPLAQNAPMILGLLNVWYASFLDAHSRAILPYAHDLARFPAYLQQLAMESNGKSVRRDGTPVVSQTGAVLWGEPGTNGQHAFHQLLHQGTRLVPADFIGFATSAMDLSAASETMHEILLSNLLAQAQVLAFGRESGEIESEGTVPELLEHKVMPGNRPSTTILAPRLTPAVLGQLIALYEHQVFVEGAVWDINSFDQWGVELGKAQALALQPAVALSEEVADCGDPSTDTLANWIRAARRAAPFD
ncbi:glucose-6-phosphate isomerase [Rhodococcus sp. T2V]|uniref:glucose-6-phosphate isomerase n=1 Tax=Rhodococcus sp. T2V TaxID=3034164 RepID=UPI0023E224DA|nr:glucose-6-phosphate isomerase [Rhodococcus sp. T2V]MDF3308226.1 glucose-6-phosphate isomerase [Rhodococcus sp. T2V]